jgi:hypothetical protein
VGMLCGGYVGSAGSLQCMCCVLLRRHLSYQYRSVSEPTGSSFAVGVAFCGVLDTSCTQSGSLVGARPPRCKVLLPPLPPIHSDVPTSMDVHTGPRGIWALQHADSHYAAQLSLSSATHSVDLPPQRQSAPQPYVELLEFIPAAMSTVQRAVFGILCLHLRATS